jgi:hypothetical protein
MDSRHDEMLRTYGVLPEMAVPAQLPIRSELGLMAAAGQWIALIVFGAGPIVLGVMVLVAAADPRTKLLGGGILLAIGLALAWVTVRQCNAWVEIDGDTLLWQHLVTRRISRREVGQLASIVTLVRNTDVGRPQDRMAAKLVEKILGRIKGFEFRFVDGARVQISRADPAMSNVLELLEATLARMSRCGTVVPEVIELRGTPLVKRLILDRP